MILESRDLAIQNIINSILIIDALGHKYMDVPKVKEAVARDTDDWDTDLKEKIKKVLDIVLE